MKAAHFLLTPNLWDSPPNDAIERAYRVCGFEVDMYSPDYAQGNARLIACEYGLRWILRNLCKLKWKQYDAFSCTTEDPVVIAGLLAFIWRKPLIVLADEIKSGSYYGNRKEYWKKLCRWAMRRANLTIVNDQSRIELQREYAGMSSKRQIIVYPGCFLQPPKAKDRAEVLAQSNIGKDKLVLGFSGFCALQNGIDWALESLQHHPNMVMLTQPLTIQAFDSYLLANHYSRDQLRIASKRLSWQQSWSSMGGVDIGVAIYNNPAPQFQNMGISSNRLCMFLAMGVPVIVSRQDSFDFIEEYECGYMVDSSEQFSQAIAKISDNLEQMKRNALHCTEHYINTAAKYSVLNSTLRNVLSISRQAELTSHDSAKAD